MLSPSMLCLLCHSVMFMFVFFPIRMVTLPVCLCFIFSAFYLLCFLMSAIFVSVYFSQIVSLFGFLCSCMSVCRSAVLHYTSRSSFLLCSFIPFLLALLVQSCSDAERSSSHLASSGSSYEDASVLLYCVPSAFNVLFMDHFFSQLTHAGSTR